MKRMVLLALRVKYFPIGLVAALALLLGGVGQAKASPIVWTASGSGGDGALDAQADFTVSNGQIQVTITNLLNPATIRSIGQSVSDLKFTLSNSPGTNTSNTAAGQLVDVNGTGTVTPVPGTPGRWISSSTGGFNITGNTILLEAIGHGSPTELILPADKGGGYPDSNASIVGHSPNTDGPATFTLNLTDVTSATTISNVIFSFGTSPDTFIDGTFVPNVNPAPEPSSLTLIGIGIAGIGGFGWWRRRKLKTA